MIGEVRKERLKQNTTLNFTPVIQEQETIMEPDVIFSYNGITILTLDVLGDAFLLTMVVTSDFRYCIFPVSSDHYGYFPLTTLIKQVL